MSRCGSWHIFSLSSHLQLTLTYFQFRLHKYRVVIVILWVIRSKIRNSIIAHMYLIRTRLDLSHSSITYNDLTCELVKIGRGLGLENCQIWKGHSREISLASRKFIRNKSVELLKVCKDCDPLYSSTRTRGVISFFASLYYYVYHIHLTCTFSVSTRWQPFIRSSPPQWGHDGILTIQIINNIDLYNNNNIYVLYISKIKSPVYLEQHGFLINYRPTGRDIAHHSICTTIFRTFQGTRSKSGP